ncbi:MAG: HEAT repeat domain-containing protein, partial [Chloroflexota bacterium]
DWPNYLAEAVNSKRELKSSALIRLSHLSHEEVGDFHQAWQGLQGEERHQLLARMVELAEDNFELDFETVFRLGLDGPEPQVKLKAIEGLAESEEPALIPTLLRLLKQDPEVSVQAAAAIALGKFVLLVELDKLHSKQAAYMVDELIAIVNQPEKSGEVRRRALESLSSLSQPRVWAEIEKAYYSQVFPLKLGSIFAMGKNHNPRWLGLLLKELSGPQPEMRYEAATACGESGEMETVPHLLPLLRDKDAEVQAAAIQALGQIGGPQSKTALRHLVQEGGGLLQELAEEALEELLADEGLDES